MVTALYNTIFSYIMTIKASQCPLGTIYGLTSIDANKSKKAAMGFGVYFKQECTLVHVMCLKELYPERMAQAITPLNR